MDEQIELWKLRSLAPRDKAEIWSSQIQTRVSLTPQSFSFTKPRKITGAPWNTSSYGKENKMTKGGINPTPSTTQILSMLLKHQLRQMREE